MAVTAVLDSNAVDAWLDSSDLSEKLVSCIEAGSLRLLYTHVTVDEIAKVPNADRRAGLLSLLAAFAHAVPTGDFVLGVSRLGMARLSGDDSPIDALRSASGKHTEDALIAGTSKYEGAVLVTYDRRLRRRAGAAGIVVRTWDELLGQLSG